MPITTKFDEDDNDSFDGTDTWLRDVRAKLGPISSRYILPDYPHVFDLDPSTLFLFSKEQPINSCLAIIKGAAKRTLKEAGDGSATAVVLTQEILLGAAKAIEGGADPEALRRGIIKATADALDALQEMAKPAEGDDLVNVLTSSVTGERAVNDVVAKVISLVGEDGVVLVDETASEQVEYEIDDGMQLETGYLSPYFVNDTERMECVLQDCFIIICEEKIRSLDALLPLLDDLTAQGHSLLIVAGDIDARVYGGRVINESRDSLESCVVKAPGGEDRPELLEDLIALTGGSILSADALESGNITPEELGFAKKVVVTQSTTTIIVETKRNAEKKAALFARIQHIRDEIKKTRPNDPSYQRAQQRLRRLAGGIATIKVGRGAKGENKRSLVESALSVVRGALEEGVVPGGGIAYIDAQESVPLRRSKRINLADEMRGAQIVHQALEIPLRQIASNTGHDGNEVLGMVKAMGRDIITVGKRKRRASFGFNVEMGRLDDLYSSGIVDTAKSTRIALENAASAATLLIAAAGSSIKVGGGSSQHLSQVKNILEGDEPVWLNLSAGVTRQNRGRGGKRSRPTKTPPPDDKAARPSRRRKQPSPPVENPIFYFELKGEAAFGNMVRYGSELDLIFNYDTPPPVFLANLQGKLLSEMLEQDVSLGISVRAKGFTFTDSEWYKVAKFSAGKLLKPVVFPLKADSTPVEEPRLYFVFSSNGCVLYEFEIHVHLTDKNVTPEDLTYTKALDLNLDEVAKSGGWLRREATLQLWSSGDNIICDFEITGEEPQPGFVLPNLTLTKLGNLLKQARNFISPAVEAEVWLKLAKPLNRPDNTEDESSLSKCLEHVVTAGSFLYGELKKADEKFGAILQTINDFPPDSRISIQTNCAFLPWEILYPLHYAENATDKKKLEYPIQPPALWGSKFSIECIVIGGNGISLPERIAAHRAGQPYISFNLNPTIDDEGDLEESLLKPIQFQRDFYNQHLEGKTPCEMPEDGEGIKQVLETKDHPATIVYLYCHGQNNDPLVSEADEMLQIDEGEKYSIKPHDLDESDKFSHAPIVILNSCSSGAISPLCFSSFPQKFKLKGAIGLVATTFPVPVTFAAAFGVKLIENYLGGLTIGESLLGLRRQLLEHHNPMGLIYALQCQMDLPNPHQKEKNI